MSGPDSRDQKKKASKAAENRSPKQPPGVFLSDDLASDTARFVAEAKERAKNRNSRRDLTLGGR